MSYEDKDELQYGKAKRSKAGSLQPRISMPKSKGKGGFAPEAVVKITAWANSPASVKRMMEYIARTTGPGEEEQSIEELQAELDEKLRNRDFKTDEERSKIEFLAEVCALHRDYSAKTAEISEFRQNELKEMYGDGKPFPAVLREFHQKLELKYQDNFGNAKVHIWNMREVHSIDLDTAMRLVNAFTEYEDKKKAINDKSAQLAQKYKGNFGNAPEDKRASLVAKHRRNDDKLKGQIFEAANHLKLPLDVVQAREAAKAARKHPKARKGEDLHIEDDLGINYKGAFDIQSLYDQWSTDFDRKKTGKQAPRHAVHVVLSAKSELNEKNIERVRTAARATARKHFGNKGFEYALGVHQDGSYPHAHLLVKCKNRDTGKKLDIRKNELHQIRKTYAKELSALGLEHVATRPRDRPKTIKKGKEVPSNWAKKENQNLLRSTKALVGNLEKEQKAFSRQLSREQPKVDAFKFREAQAKSMETQRVKLKSDEKLNEKDRREAFNTLRGFRRKVEKGLSPEIEAKATCDHLLGSIEKWEKDARKTDLGNDKLDHASQGQKLLDRVDRFAVSLRTVDLPLEMKKSLHRSMREKKTEMKKSKLIARGRSR
ncbi:MAG: relaxase/mobilization nuclease domain-containing protein [Pseudodesulfovibrio sp.]